MRTVLAALSLAIVVTTAGCRPSAPKNSEAAPVAQAEPKKDPPKKDPGKNDGAPEPFKKPPIRGGSVVRRVDEADVNNMMNQLKLATTLYQNDHNNRYPNSLEELAGHFENNAKINQALKDGDIVYIWKARRPEDPSKTILAYEGQADTLNRRVVLLANGDIKTVNVEEFNALEKMSTK